jgi:phage/plasmid-associated DNA primase
LDANLSDPKELSGVLNKALEVLPKIRKHGFTESRSMQEAWEEFRAMTDPVSVWLNKATVEHAQAIVPKSILLQAYNQHCDDRGQAGMSSKSFSQAVKRLRPKLADGQRTVSGNVVWCWLGLGLASPEPDPQDPTDSQLSRVSRDPSNCFLIEAESGTRDKNGREETEITNKGNRVNRVNRVNETGAMGLGEAANLNVEDVLLALQSEGSGPSKMYSHYLEMPSDQRLEYLVKAVLNAEKLDNANWQRYLPVVLEASAQLEGGQA